MRLMILGVLVTAIVLVNHFVLADSKTMIVGSTTTNYLDVGAAQHEDPAGGAAVNVVGVVQ